MTSVEFANDQKKKKKEEKFNLIAHSSFLYLDSKYTRYL